MEFIIDGIKFDWKTKTISTTLDNPTVQVLYHAAQETQLLSPSSCAIFYAVQEEGNSICLSLLDKWRLADDFPIVLGGKIYTDRILLGDVRYKTITG